MKRLYNQIIREKIVCQTAISIQEDKKVKDIQSLADGLGKNSGIVKGFNNYSE